MAASMPNRAESLPVRPVDRTRPASALVVEDSPSELTGLIAEAIRRTGAAKEAAADMAIDPSQLTRQIENGHLTAERMNRLKPAAKAELGRLLVEAYAPVSTPSAYIRAKARELRDVATHLDQVAEYLS